MSIPQDWLSFKGSEFEQTGHEPKGPFENKRVSQILKWLFSRGWHYASIPGQGIEGIQGMRMDKHVGFATFCSVLEAYRMETAAFMEEMREQIDRGELE